MWFFFIGFFLSITSPPQIPKYQIGTEKNHDSQRRDRIPRFFLHPEIGQFSPHLGPISLLNCTENLERKAQWRKLKKSKRRNVPEIADFCPLSWSNVSWPKNGFTWTFSKSLRELCLLPCDANQEPSGSCSDKLVQMNFFILDGFLRVHFAPKRKLDTSYSSVPFAPLEECPEGQRDTTLTSEPWSSIFCKQRLLFLKIREITGITAQVGSTTEPREPLQQPLWWEFKSMAKHLVKKQGIWCENAEIS